MNKNIDQISLSLDSILEGETIDLTPETVFKKHHQKKMKEQRGNKKMILGVIFACVGLALFHPDKFNLIHLGLFFVLGVINLWVNESAARKIENVDVTTSFSEFADKRRFIAQTILNQFKVLRATSIVCIALAFMTAIYRYTVTQDHIYLGLHLVLMAIGSFIALRASHQGVLEYQRLSKE